MEGHVALVTVAEVGHGIFRPLVRFRQQHAVGEAFVDVLAQLLEEGMRLRKVLTVAAVPLVEVRYRVEAQAIDPKPQPEVDHLQHRLTHRGVVEVEVGLMRVEAVPVVAFAVGCRVQFDASKSLKMMRASLYFLGVSLHT